MPLPYREQRAPSKLTAPFPPAPAPPGRTAPEARNLTSSSSSRCSVFKEPGPASLAVPAPRLPEEPRRGTQKPPPVCGTPMARSRKNAPLGCPSAEAGDPSAILKLCRGLTGPLAGEILPLSPGPVNRFLKFALTRLAAPGSLPTPAGDPHRGASRAPSGRCSRRLAYLTPRPPRRQPLCGPFFRGPLRSPVGPAGAVVRRRRRRYHPRSHPSIPQFRIFQHLSDRRAAGVSGAAPGQARSASGRPGAPEDAPASGCGRRRKAGREVSLPVGTPCRSRCR